MRGDRVQLWWSGSDEPRAATLLAQINAWQSLPWPTWPLAASDQGRVSPKLALVRGRRYWLELLCGDTRGSCGGVGVRSHSSQLSRFALDSDSPQHPDAVHEVQTITLQQSSAQREVQTVRATALGAQQISMLGVGVGLSLPFDRSATAATVSTALRPLLGVGCRVLFPQPESWAVFDLDLFESADEAWTSLGYGNPTVLTAEDSEPHCGSGLLYLQSSCIDAWSRTLNHATQPPYRADRP